MKRTLQIFLACCAVFFCAGSAFGQGYDTCAHLKSFEYGQPQNEAEYKRQYDTLRLYVEKCAPTDCGVADAFSNILSDVQFMSNDISRFDTLRSWLILVLYLNTNCEDYFCSVVATMASTFQYGQYHPLGHLAVLNYLRQNHPNCWNSAGDEGYAQDSAYDAQHGADPSHLPPLDSLGLGFLLKDAVTPSTGGKSSSQYLASFTSSSNPFRKETTLEFTLNRLSYVTLAVYDELGRLVWGDGKGSSLEAGTHAIHLDGSSLPSGTLYARIATGFGEVKTVVLVHDK